MLSGSVPDAKLKMCERVVSSIEVLLTWGLAGCYRLCDVEAAMETTKTRPLDLEPREAYTSCCYEHLN